MVAVSDDTKLTEYFYGKEADPLQVDFSGSLRTTTFAETAVIARWGVFMTAFLSSF